MGFVMHSTAARAVALFAAAWSSTIRMLFACCCMSSRVALGCHNSYLGSCQRQHDDERRPVAFAPTARLDGPAVQLDQTADDGEPEPEAGLPLRCPGGVRLAEGVEDVGKEVDADALARVAHGDARQPVLAFQRDLDAAAPRRELERVARRPRRSARGPRPSPP